MEEEILSFAEIKNRLADKRLYIVAKRTGLSYTTLKKLREGEDDNFTLATLRKISQYLTNSNN